MGQAVRPLADPVAPHSHIEKPDERQGAKQTMQPRIPVPETKASKPLTKSVGVEAAGETKQSYPPGNQHQKGPICLWVMEDVTKGQLRTEQEGLFPLGRLPHIQHHNAAP